MHPAQPKAFSASQLTLFLTCPRKYRFRYIEKREPERTFASLAFGRAIHQAIGWWWTERKEGREPTLADVQRVFRADWTAERTDPKLDLEEESPEHYVTLGETLLGVFIERFKDEPIPEEVEKRVEVSLIDPRTGEVLDVPLIGFVDAANDNTVFELKTCARKTDPSQWAMQLAAYRYAWRSTTGTIPRLQVIELVKTKVPKLEVVDVDVTDRDEEWFLEVVVEVLRAVEAGAFFPSPGWQCGTCEYRSRCKRDSSI